MSSVETAPPPPLALKTSPVRNWYAHLLREWMVESQRAILPAENSPRPSAWSDADLNAAWLGHSTVLINFYGFVVLTDPVLFPRIGVRFPGLTIGPKRLTAPALTARDLPPIDLVLLSHAHFDHFDTRTLHRVARGAHVISAPNTLDILRWTRAHAKAELRWGESTMIKRRTGELIVRAFPVRHWGARLRRDVHRGYNGYVLERAGHRIIFGGDTAITDSFAALRSRQRFDLAIMPIGAYDPWIRSHATPEQAVTMANAAGADYIMPVHHQTFRLSAEPFFEPIERLESALHREAERIAVHAIGETFRLPPN